MSDCAGGAARLALDFELDHLLIAPGSETNFFDLPGVSEWAVTMKTLTDAALLRNRVLGLLEEASQELRRYPFGCSTASSLRQAWSA